MITLCSIDLPTAVQILIDTKNLWKNVDVHVAYYLGKLICLVDYVYECPIMYSIYDSEVMEFDCESSSGGRVLTAQHLTIISVRTL